MRFAFLFVLLLVSPLTQAFEHADWSKLLSDHVEWVDEGHASVVDYQGFMDDRDALKDYLDALSGVSLNDYEQWDHDKQLAFLINAYNAFTVELILRHYPDLDSIRDIGNWFSGPWDKDFFRLLGEKRTLDELEHEMIRQWFDEPRIHFAVNCASVGCPALRPEPFTAERLDDQLEDSTRRFLGDDTHNYFDEKTDTLHVSPIFKWYDEDFEAGGSVKDYLANYAALFSGNESGQKIIRNGSYSLKYTDYDWRLNIRENVLEDE